MRRSASFTVAAVLTLVAGAAGAACSPDVVELKGQRGASRFSVEIADDDEERARGLMFREHMPTSAGMLFIYDTPAPVSFWMRNTLIPLDMIFVDARGVVTSVHSNARPRDETPIPGKGLVRAVLEINGGLAGRLGISAGDVMRHPSFAQADAAWSCETP